MTEKKNQVSTRCLHNLRKEKTFGENGVQYFYLGKQIRYKSVGHFFWKWLF